MVVDPNNWVLNATGTITNGGVIPVKLLSFDGISNNNCTALLKWKTSNEQNILNYEMQYSHDGINFTKAGTLPGKNNSAESSYQFNYSLCSGNIHYFRLKITEVNGSYTYSQLIAINKKCSNTFSLNLAPNPVAEKLVMTINQPATDKTTITLLNTVGSILYKEEKILNAGENIIKLEAMNKFAAGTYLVRITNSGETVTRKFVKL